MFHVTYYLYLRPWRSHDLLGERGNRMSNFFGMMNYIFRQRFFALGNIRE